jgi:Sulfatase
MSNVRKVNLSIFLFLPVLFKLLYMRIVMINLPAGKMGVLYALLNDVAYFSLIIVMVVISFRVGKVFSIILRLMVSLLFVFYLADFIVLYSFYTRLNLADIPTYYGSALEYFHVALPWLVKIVVAFYFAFFLWWLILGGNGKVKVGWRLMLVPLFFGGSVKLLANSGEVYVESWLYQDPITLNWEAWYERKSYSSEFIKKFSFESDKVCKSISKKSPNVILLMVESLSSYQSDLFSGLNNWTPRIDEIAKKNYYCDNFFSNGFTTADAEIALLTGKLPLLSPEVTVARSRSSFKGFYNVPDTLPKILSKYGYATSFFTTSSLRFSDTGGWAKSIGFDHVEGDEVSSYEGLPRYHFNSVPDHFLYQRLKRKLEDVGENRFFWFVKTVSTHHPFLNPETEVRSEEVAFRYADKELGLFYEYLEESSYFDSGLLIIVGDHHAMTPLRAEEIERFGRLKAPAYVPLIVVGGQFDKEVSHLPFQQVDIYNSIRSMVEGESCTSSWVGDLWRNVPPDYILHKRGDRRYLLSVFSEKQDFEVKLAAEETAVLNDYVSEDDAREILGAIHSARLQ